jgi:hypothetical protein
MIKIVHALTDEKIKDEDKMVFVLEVFSPNDEDHQVFARIKLDGKEDG